MPSGKNWINFIYINLAFGIYIAGVFYFSQLAEIKANWPLYRCNPMYMPLADNVESNFTYCIQNMQSDYIDAMKDIKQSEEFQDQMNLQREKEVNRMNNDSTKTQIEREKIQAQKEIADKQLAIARENKNKYDKKE